MMEDVDLNTAEQLGLPGSAPTSLDDGAAAVLGATDEAHDDSAGPPAEVKTSRLDLRMVSV